MNEEEKFDELLNSKLSEREFPFDELNWDEAERLIIQQERWSKIKRYSLIFSAGLAAGVVIMLPFIINSHNALPSPLVTKSTNMDNVVVQNNVTAPVKQSQVNTANNVNKEVKAPLPVQSAFVKKNSSTGIRANTSSKIVSAGKKAKVQPILLATNDDKKIHKSHSRQTTKPNLVASTVNMNKISRHTKASTPEEPNSSSTIATDVVNSPPVSNNHLTESGSSSENNNSSPVIASANNNTVNKDLKADNNSNAVIADNKLPVVSSAPVQTPTAANNSSRNSNSNSPKTKGDTNKTATHQILPGTPTTDRSDYAKNILSVYAGANYCFGWSYNGDREANGITPWAGVDYTRYFSRKWALMVGAGYGELNNLNKTYISSIIQYDFGATGHIIDVTPQKVFYLAVPMKFQYNFDNNDLLSAGINCLILMTTSSTLNTYQQTYFSNTLQLSETENGYTQGFSNFDFQFEVAYTRMFTNRFGAGFDIYWGLGYVENNTFPGSNQFERNNGFRLVLSYQLMK